MECITYRELQRITAVELEERLRHGVMEVSVNGQVWFRLAGRLSRKIDDKNERAVARSRALMVIGGNDAIQGQGITEGSKQGECQVVPSTEEGYDAGYDDSRIGETITVSTTPASTEGSSVGSSVI